MSSTDSVEIPALAPLSLEDDHFRATIPPPLENWDTSHLDWKQREERMVENLKRQDERLDQALKQTKKRWSWFVQAKSRDIERHTSFGTLGYLPLEIRVKIYGLVFNTQVRQIPKYWGDFRCIPPWRPLVMRYKPPMWWMHFDYEACAFGCWNGKGDLPDSVLRTLNLRAINPRAHSHYHDRKRPQRRYPGPLNLRTYFSEVGCLPARLRTPFVSVSRSLRDEFGDYMIGSRNFSFRCPASFSHFLCTLTPRQHDSLRRITIDLTGPPYPFGCRETVPDPEAWMSVFTDLPSELASLSEVTIMVGEDAPSFKDETGNTVAWYQDEDDTIGKALLPLYSIDEVANILGIVAKGISAVAPEAKFIIPEYEYLEGGDHGEGPIFYKDSDNGKITSALWRVGVSGIHCTPYKAQLVYAAADETPAD